MKRLLTIAILCLALPVFAARAKTYRTVRLSDGTELKVRHCTSRLQRLASPITEWDATKTYCLPVLLMSFSDREFNQENPREFYNRVFNEPGFNLGLGPGCVADYFKDQSLGQFNIRLDVFGPIQLSSSFRVSDQYGTSLMREIVRQADDQVDYSLYDWEGNGRVRSVIVVFAGYGGNETAAAAKGCIMPNTGSLSVSVDGVIVGGYSASPEMWTNDKSCGIGTICHEFSHVLGLPDYYPTSGSEFSVLDEWNLMDGGNFAGDGWCPPNYSVVDRAYLGWQQPVQLMGAQTVTDMPSYSSSARAYSIVNDAKPSEYYLLENRQWEGWDMMLPSHGLLITHVDFSESSWHANSVNSSRSHHRMEYFHADGLDFNYYQSLWGTAARYGADGRNLRLQHTAYPYTDSLAVCHDALTDTSSPAAILFNVRDDGSRLMGKAITGISEHNGLITFSLDDTPSAIETRCDDARPVAVYDLQGRRYPTSLETLPSAVYIVRYSDGTTKKLCR